MRKVVSFLLLVLVGLALGGCGVDWFPATAGVTVTPFSFAAKTNVTSGATVTSDPVTITFTGATTLPISVSGATGSEYSTDGGTTFKSTAGTVTSGSSVVVRHTASSTAGASVTTTLTVGSVTADFTSTVGVALAFSPAYLYNVTPSTTQTSNALTVTLSTSSAPISITGGEYQINNGAFTSAAGTVNNNDKVTVRHTSADGTTNTTVTTTLTVGSNSATFASTTGNVIAQTVDISGTPDSILTASVTLHLVNGSYLIHVVRGANAFGTYSLNGVDYNIDDSTQTLTDGKVLSLQDFAPGTVGDVNTTTFFIDGVPIVLNVHAVAP